MGSFNLIIRPALFDRCSTAIMSAAILYVTGTLQRIGEVLYIEAETIAPLDALMSRVAEGGVPSRSYSY
jgi:hypothetical protein